MTPIYSIQYVACVHRLDEPSAPETIHSIFDSFVEWSETKTQIDQFLGGVLCPHDPSLPVLVDSDVKTIA
jgi:hypothetical protein